MLGEDDKNEDTGNEDDFTRILGGEHDEDNEDGFAGLLDRIQDHEIESTYST